MTGQMNQTRAAYRLRTVDGPVLAAIQPAMMQVVPGEQPAVAFGSASQPVPGCETNDMLPILGSAAAM